MLADMKLNGTSSLVNAAQLGEWQVELDGEPVVYLLHFQTPYKHARHYMGTAYNLQRRLEQHEKGTRAGGARLMEVVVVENGIDYQVARLWKGSYQLEVQLKKRKAAPRLCPICKAAARRARQEAKQAREACQPAPTKKAA